MDEISKGEIFYNSLSHENKAKIAASGMSKAEVVAVFNKVCNALDCVTSAINNLLPTITKVAAGIGELYKNILTNYPNKRVVHLAKHGKRLTRKKNAKRISRWLDQ